MGELAERAVGQYEEKDQGGVRGPWRKSGEGSAVQLLPQHYDRDRGVGILDVSGWELRALV